MIRSDTAALVGAGREPRRIVLPAPYVVVLVGPAGAGKSTFARRHFDPAEILSSDAFRGLVRGDPADQTATRTAFSILHRELTRRLARRASVVVDATNLTVHARAAILRRAAIAATQATAVVLAPPAVDVHARNVSRATGAVPAAVVDAQLVRLAALGSDVAAIDARLRREGFAAVHVLTTVDEIATAVVERGIG